MMTVPATVAGQSAHMAWRTSFMFICSCKAKFTPHGARSLCYAGRVYVQHNIVRSAPLLLQFCGNWTLNLHGLFVIALEKLLCNTYQIENRHVVRRLSVLNKR